MMQFTDTYTTIYRESPTKTPNMFTPDGALAGNGDIGLVLGGKPSALELYISKTDMWNALNGEKTDDRKPGGVSPLAIVRILMPTFYFSDYYAEQRMKKGEIYCRFCDGTCTAELRFFACACENGAIRAEILSEKGFGLTLENPYTDQICTVTSAAGTMKIAPGGTVTLKTAPGEKFSLA